MSDENISKPEFDLDAMKPAGFWIRVLASLIDMLVLLVFIVGGLFMKSVVGYLLLSLPVILYKPILEGLLGGTAGKLALGLKVVNEDGELIGLSGGFIRAGIFIVNSIPNTLLQVKMIQQGISPIDPVAVTDFKSANNVMYLVSYAISMVVLISCVVVAFNARKRGLHDMIADTYVIYKDKTVGSTDE